MFKAIADFFAKCAEAENERQVVETMNYNISSQIANLIWISKRAGRHDAGDIINGAFKSSLHTAFVEKPSGEELWRYNEHLRFIMFDAFMQEPHKRLPYIVQQLKITGEIFAQHRAKGETVIS